MHTGKLCSLCSFVSAELLITQLSCYLDVGLEDVYICACVCVCMCLHICIQIYTYISVHSCVTRNVTRNVCSWHEERGYLFAFNEKNVTWAWWSNKGPFSSVTRTMKHNPEQWEGCINNIFSRKKLWKWYTTKIMSSISFDNDVTWFY